MTVSKDQVLAVLARHVGASYGIGVRELTRAVTGEGGCEHLERAVRGAIHELRMDGHHVCAHPSTGYYLAATAEELDRTCEYLHDRAMCSLKQVARMKGVSEPDLRGQLRLPT